MAQAEVGEMEMHSVANLATLQTPLVIFFLQKSTQTLFSFSESPVLTREVLLSQHAHTSFLKFDFIRRGLDYQDFCAD